MAIIQKRKGTTTQELVVGSWVVVLWRLHHTSSCPTRRHRQPVPRIYIMSIVLYRLQWWQFQWSRNTSVGVPTSHPKAWFLYLFVFHVFFYVFLELGKEHLKWSPQQLTLTGLTVKLIYCPVTARLKPDSQFNQTWAEVEGGWSWRGWRGSAAHGRLYIAWSPDII